MTTQQTDIEKTLKRILARELKEWPKGALVAYQSRVDSEIYFDDQDGEGGYNCYLRSGISAVDPLSGVTRAEWEAERALLASEQAQPLVDSEEFDQALWDKVAIAAIGGLTASDIFYNSSMFQYRPDNAAEFASGIADAFMADRAKRIAERKASHD